MPSAKLYFRCFLLMVVSCCTAQSVRPLAAQEAAASKGRALTLDDLFSLEELGRYFGGPFAIAPDGQAVAFVRLRPQNHMKDFALQFLWGGASADIWLQRHPGETPARLTPGEEEGSGWWAPQWSPDGKRLAMLSTHGGNVCLWVEEIATHQRKQLSLRGVELNDIRHLPYQWIDATHLLVPLLPAGEQPLSMRIDTETPQVATTGWRLQREGKQVTASVLDSGEAPDLAKRPHSQLEFISVESGDTKIVADEDTASMTPAPDNRHVAYLRQVSAYTPKASEALPFGAAMAKKFSTVVQDIAGNAVMDSEKYSRDVLPDSLRWSADGSRLAFLGYDETRDKCPDLFVLDIAARSVKRISLDGLDAAPIIRLNPQLLWSGAEYILLLAAQTANGKTAPVEVRRDWWRIDSDGSRHCLTCKAAKAPAALWPESDRKSFIGMAEDKLWRIVPSDLQVSELPVSLPGKLSHIVWPVAEDDYGYAQLAPANGYYSDMVVSIGEGEEQPLYRVSLASGATTELAKPSPSASLDAWDPAHGSMLFSSSGRTGTFLWRVSSPLGKTDTLVEANQFLNEIASAGFKQIEYTSLDGEKLKAWILLPYHYEPGKTYPTLTWVYAGSVASSKPSLLADISFFSALNLQIAAAHGYAVVIPSMPLNPEGAVDDPMLRLMNGVMPAVDKTVELGIADPARLYLMGQSFGGFSTYGLVTQTHRFKAAVSLAGLSDLISLYGLFDARERYGAFPHEDLFMEALSEVGQTRMGNPPWKDLGRYLRNSPIFYVDRVETPVLIIQGDLDYVAMQQGEEFFRALYRQGKRARFVRYWGEDHVLASPANIRDMWSQIFDWLDNASPLSKANCEAPADCHKP